QESQTPKSRSLRSRRDWLPGGTPDKFRCAKSQTLQYSVCASRPSPPSAECAKQFGVEMPKW
ncbi:MAG: hypothetical protein ACRD3D_11445, partial [Terriglobia bacterium]